MSTTTITLVTPGNTDVDFLQQVTVIEHGTIGQPYAGPMIYVQPTEPVAPNEGDIWYNITP